MKDTGPQPPDKEAEQRKQEERELAKAHKRLWDTPDGKRVLADLERRTNYAKGPFAVGIGHGDLSYRCGTQDPVRYIHELRDKVLTPMGKPPARRMAKSGTVRSP